MEIDDIKIGKRKFLRGHFVKIQWILGSVDRNSRCYFIIVISDGTSRTFLSLFETRIEPRTLVILHCWKVYKLLDQRDYGHATANHTLYFNNPETEICPNTIESYWCHFEASFLECNWQEDFGRYWDFFCLRVFVGIDTFVKFFNIIQGINWADW